MIKTELTLKQFKPLFLFALNRNKELEDQGKRPITFGIEGEAGIGKSEFMENTAKELGMTVSILNLAQIEDNGDLEGLPIKEYEIKRIHNGEEDRKWIPEALKNNLPAGTSLTGNIRTSYATPKWLPSEFNPNGTVIIFDDFSRANPMFMQSIMEIINKGRFHSWTLPKYTTILLNSNPQDGDYSVSFLDKAITSRYANFRIKFNTDEWAEYADSVGMDFRCINFATFFKSELFENENAKGIVNARNYTKFCDIISGIKDWSTIENLNMIKDFASGFFPDDENNIVGTSFVSFVANKYDRIPLPEDFWTRDWDKIKAKLEDCLYDNGKFRAEISSALANRVVYYCLTKFKEKGGLQEKVVHDRLMDVINNDKVIFTEDQFFYSLKTLVKEFPGRTTSLITNPLIRKKLCL